MKHIVTTLLILPLVACGGSSSTPTPRSAVAIETENRFLSAAEAHETAFDENAMRVLPTTGTTTSAGAFKAKYEQNGRNGRIVGDVRATFDFAGNDMTATVSDMQSFVFASPEGEERATSGGTLTITGDRSATPVNDSHKFIGTITGNVNMPSSDGSATVVSNAFTLNSTSVVLRKDPVLQIAGQSTPTDTSDDRYEREAIGARGDFDGVGQTLPDGITSINGQWSGTVVLP